MIRSRLPVAVVLAVACAAAPARADDEIDRRALVLLRVLAYDRNLAERAGDRVAILVVYDESRPAPSASADERDGWVGALAAARKIKVADRAIVTHTHAFRDAKELDAVVREVRPAAIVVCVGLHSALAAIRGVSRARKAMTFSTRQTEVEAGFAVGLVAGERRDSILINVEAARAEGVQFEAGLLKVAKRTGGDPP